MSGEAIDEVGDQVVPPPHLIRLEGTVVREWAVGKHPKRIPVSGTYNAPHLGIALTPYTGPTRRLPSGQRRLRDAWPRPPRSLCYCRHAPRRPARCSRRSPADRSPAGRAIPEATGRGTPGPAA